MANFITQDSIDAVLRISDIVSVVSDYVKLEKRGSEYWGCCPFHNEKTPSFHVVPEKNMYYCFGCHAGGSAVKFIEEMEKISYPEAIKFLAKKNGIELQYTDQGVQTEKVDNTKDLYIDLYNRVSTTFHYYLLNREEGKFALDYIKNRGITSETIEKFKLGYSPANRRWLKAFLVSKNFSNDFLSKSGLFSTKYPDIAFFSDRLMFPIFDRRGQVVAFGGRFLRGDAEKSPKYLNSSDMIQYKKGETLYAFNFAKQAIRQQKKVIFCEGYMDCIAYHQCNIQYAVAPLGTALTEEQINLVKGFVSEILLSFDSDSAGQNATWRAIKMCRKMGITVRIIQLKGGKDPAEIMIKYGSDVLTSYVNTAILDSDYLLNFLAQNYPIDTPEGKTKAALRFFEYIDVLQTDIQKESCKEQLSHAFNIPLEAVKKDFLNRNQITRTLPLSQSKNQQDTIPQIHVDAELRSLLAVIADTTQFEKIGSQISENDFENESAKDLFKALKQCYERGDMSVGNVLDHCNDRLQRIILDSFESGEFSENTAQAVVDGIELKKKDALRSRRDFLQNEISRIPPTKENQEILAKLIAEKMDLAKKLDKKD